jgi:FkbM family methyltransferase
MAHENHRLTRTLLGLTGQEPEDRPPLDRFDGLLYHILRQGVRAALPRVLCRIGLRLARRWPLPVPVQVNGRAFHVDLRSGIGRGIYMRGEFDPAVFEPIRAALRRGDIFLDVGANIGWYSFLAAQLVGPEGRVHAFEIDRRPLGCFERTIRTNRDLPIVLHRLAVGDRVGEVAFIEARESGHSRLTRDDGGRHVPMSSLDTVFAGQRVGPIRAIKIDVEGAELHVLRGARRLLEEQRPIVVCELVEEGLRVLGGSRAEAIALLRSLGYEVADLPGAWTPAVIGRPERKP